MRTLKNAGIKVGSALRMDQYRLTSHVDVEQLWNEWEIQLLVLASFALQVFLLLFSGTRKRSTSSKLRVLVWLAYVLADYLAVFILGHMTLHINGPRHGLVLFWAPFMLLHLGGQETITAFSMEDNMLWKRHLLSLVTQAGLAAYVVGKQWQGDRRLLAPMVLMFVSGTLKYAGRTSALMHAAKQITPGSSNISLLYKGVSSKPEDLFPGHWVKVEKSYARTWMYADNTVSDCLAFLMDKKPLLPRPQEFPFQLEGFLSDDQRVHIHYKLPELQLRLLYDFFYTKLGAIIASLFIYISSVGTGRGEIFFTMATTVHPESRPHWSQKLAQYNLIGGCIEVKRAANGLGGVLRGLMHVAGINQGTWTHAEVSHELKRLVLDKLADVACRIHEDLWDGSKFTGQWAKLELRSKKQGTSSSTLLRLLARSIEHPSFISSVLTWHIATDICFFDEDHLDCNDDSPSSRTPSWELSNYVMFLCAEDGIMSGNDGQILLESAREFIHYYLRSYQESLDATTAVVRHIAGIIAHEARPQELVPVEPALILALQLVQELRMMKASDRWGIIINVWMEMLCYMSFHCGPDFHIKHLSTGGEFITHVKALIHNLDLPYSMSVPENDEEPSNPGQSFACMSEVRSLEDLQKKDNPYKQKIKPCKSYAAMGGGMPKANKAASNSCANLNIVATNGFMAHGIHVNENGGYHQ
ncbi:hypothetical protein EJB05_36743 [Eragrostis curvula]|uniref:DUF4220 domain-containing protein n=1 Tax=Eragrostis curvula TaxID=38414 RepID=A0A5J9UBF8_9POAL|nr:hypothetical protein EJB05_36743 [Eragrostis curvula]